MRPYNSVTVAPVRCLEPGDLIAFEIVGTVVSGKVTAVVYAAYQLTDEQREYMKKHDLSIPENEYEGLGGSSSYLVFGDFIGTGFNSSQPNHAYLDFDRMVAAFPYEPRPSQEILAP